MSGDRPDDKSAAPSARLGLGGWIAIVELLAFLGWAAWFAVHTWTALAGVAMSAWGWVFMILGIVVTLAVGGGLMWLVFYSSRTGKDF